MNKNSNIKSVSVFCGASNAADQKHIDLAKECGQRLAKEGLKLIYGGGDCGLMGAVSSSAKKAGGSLVGVSTQIVSDKEISHKGSEHTYITQSMFERKKDLFFNSDAFICLSGGFGTLDEIFEIVTLKYLGEKELVNQKPIIIVNHDHYWDPLLELIDHIIANKFANKAITKNYVCVTSIDDAFKELGF